MPKSLLARYAGASNGRSLQTAKKAVLAVCEREAWVRGSTMGRRVRRAITERKNASDAQNQSVTARAAGGPPDDRGGWSGRSWTHGVIRTTEDREVFFHRSDVTLSSFNDLPRATA